jgi:hypothetical protein
LHSLLGITKEYEDETDNLVELSEKPVQC